MSLSLRVWMIGLLTLCACPSDKPPSSGGRRNVCLGQDSTVLCSGTTAIACEDQEVVSSTRCDVDGLTCFAGIGCRACVPFSVTCENNRIYTCNVDGTEKMAGTQCDASAGEFCSSDGCHNLCAEAEEGQAYIGCEYWPVTLPNTQLSDAFEFAVVVANPQLVPADIRIEVGGSPWTNVTVDPGSARSISLPWVTPIFRATASSITVKGAYRLTSNVPVVAYQFNPLEYRTDDVFSFTNDASLLLPAHALTAQYLGISRSTLQVSQLNNGNLVEFVSPGFLAIAATRPGATTVHVRFRAYVRALDEDNGPYAPGDEADFTLGQGDVLTLLSARQPECAGEQYSEADGRVRYCDGGPAYDLTGTEITADQPIAVFGGHDCSFVPFNRWACDHLEEQLFPLEAWDNEALLAVSQKLSDEPNVLRVISATDNNLVSFTPRIAEDITLDRGEYFETTVSNDVLVNASAPVLVAQFLVGQEYDGLGRSTTNLGDPSLGLVPPSGQLRSDYVFLAPDTYVDNYANITAPIGTEVRIDGERVVSWQTSATAAYISARVRVRGGMVHRVTGSAPFALLVYGYASYTSYLYTGGLDLERISLPIL